MLPLARAVLARKTVRAALVRLVAGVLVLIAGIAVFSLVSDLISRDKYRQAAVTEVGRSSVAEELLVDLLSAQTGQRAFVITEDFRTLDRFERAVEEYLLDLARTEALLADDRELSALLARVGAAADQWLAVGNREIQQLNLGNRELARDSVLDGPGERTFNRFRAAHTQLIRELDQRRLDAVDEARTWGFAALVAGVLAALLAGGIVAFAGMRVVRRVTGPLSALQAATRRISRGDYGQAVPIKGQPDELRDLASAFNTMQLDLAAARRELEDRARELEAASRLKSEFVANVTHELRTPLAAIIGYSQLLLEPDEEPLTTSQQHEVQTILTAAEHLLGLIDDVLDLARIEGGHMAISSREVDARDLVRQSTRAVASLATAKDLNMSVALPDTPVPAYCDPGKMRQVLINLLGNAVKFTDDGTVSVRARQVGERCQLSVTDTGLGIPASQIDLIWEEFRQLDGSLTRRQGGAGLGLAITRRLLELQGGTVTCESEVGVGTTFTVDLPAHPPGVRGRAAGVGGGQVLIVQADARRAEGMAGSLREAGAEPLVASGPEAAIAILEDGAPACVVLDLELPAAGRDGILRRLHERPAGEEPGLVLTLADEDGNGLAASVDAVLREPLSRPRLMEAIARADVDLTGGVAVVDDPGDRRRRLESWLQPLGPVRAEDEPRSAAAAVRDGAALLLVDPLCTTGAGLAALLAAGADGASPAVVAHFGARPSERPGATLAGIPGAEPVGPALVREVGRLEPSPAPASV